MNTRYGIPIAGVSILIAALGGCDDQAGQHDAARTTSCSQYPGNEASGLTPDYYAVIAHDEDDGQTRYFSDREAQARAELDSGGLTGVRSQYSSQEVATMRKLLTEEDWSTAATFSFGVNPRDDVFEVFGQLDEDRLAEVLDGHTYRFVPMEVENPTDG